MWGLDGKEGALGEVGVSRAGVATLTGWRERCGQPLAILGDPPGLLRTVGKWCPVWGDIDERFHPFRGLDVRTA